MIEILRTNDSVLLSWASAILDGARIDFIVLDQHTAFAEGSIGAIQRRLMVLDEDAVAARSLLVEASPDPKVFAV